MNSSQGKKLVLWGAAGNGSALLNMCHIDNSLIEYVIDSDQRKQNQYVSGTGQKVVAPHSLIGYSPDIIIVTSQLHKTTIKNDALKLYGSTCTVITTEEIQYA